MSFLFKVCNILVIFTIVECSFFNPYRQLRYYSDDDDPGEPLYLTEYIESGDIEKAQNLASVHHPDIGVLSYAGYLTVNKGYNSNLFFWFFPAEFSPDDAPVLLWLQGGPGSTSLYGLFTENGPVSINARQFVETRQYSWHLNHNLIYIDNPVGTGFSFSDEAGYTKNEVDVGHHLLIALRQFFLLFPKLKKNEFFVSGESYAGKYVPAIGYAIYQDSKRESVDLKKPKINLKGLLIGNGLSDPIHQYNYADYLYQLGLLDTNGHAAFVAFQKEGIKCIKDRDFLCAFNVFDSLMDGDQHPQGSLFKNLTGFENYFNFLNASSDVDDLPFGEFVQRSSTRRAVHVGNNTFHGLDDSDNKVEDYLIYDIYDSVADWVAELLSHYPILIYTGQLDIIVPYPLTENYLQHLNFSAAEDYKTAKRYIWRVDSEIAGYVKHAGNLTEVLVRDAGHMVPHDQPKWALDMLLRFTHHKGFY